jgi:hypothetical protein
MVTSLGLGIPDERILSAFVLLYTLHGKSEGAYFGTLALIVSSTKKL